MIKAISLWQAWALLCLLKDEQGKALKAYETRSWATNYRGVLVIHAAKRWTREEERWLCSKMDRFHLYHQPLHDLIEDAHRPKWLGAALGTVEMRGCYEMYEDDLRAHGYIGIDSISERERAFGNWQQGRYAWKFINPRLFPEPIPMRGYQQLWEVTDPPVLEAIQLQKGVSPQAFDQLRMGGFDAVEAKKPTRRYD